MTRRAAIRRAAHGGRIPLYAQAFRPIRGRCRGALLPSGRRRRCDSRYAIVRVSVDLTDARRIDKLATVECASCGHTWRRCRVPALTAPNGDQLVRLSLVVPAEVRRWYARGRWHAEGETGVIREATVADYIAALADWRTRFGRVEAARLRAAERKAAEERAAHERMADLLAKLAEHDAQREAEERAAEAREG
ncbi:MAG TPA: hypothetical protein VIV06_04190 [Candidatus Limnocylindrales bacterium]